MAEQLVSPPASSLVTWFSSQDVVSFRISTNNYVEPTSCPRILVCSQTLKSRSKYRTIESSVMCLVWNHETTESHIIHVMWDFLLSLWINDWMSGDVEELKSIVFWHNQILSLKSAGLENTPQSLQWTFINMGEIWIIELFFSFFIQFQHHLWFFFFNTASSSSSFQKLFFLTFCCTMWI